MNSRNLIIGAIAIGFIFFAFEAFSEPVSINQDPLHSEWPFWIWPIILFVFTFFLGLLSVSAGIGGGVLFVPIVSALFPFHLDFVRGAGLMVALSGALSAGPGLLRKQLADLRLALPMAFFASIGAIAGAQIGLALPENVVKFLLGVVLFFIVILMLMAKKSDFPEVTKPDALSRIMKIHGTYFEESLNREISWNVHRTIPAMFLFIFIGFLTGLFGMGAGWANIPVLNLVLGAPLKISVATSIFILSISDTTAAWIYLHNGGLLPIIVLPSVTGMMIGTKFGVRILARSSPAMIKKAVIVFLILAGIRALSKGLMLWKFL